MSQLFRKNHLRRRILLENKGRKSRFSVKNEIMDTWDSEIQDQGQSTKFKPHPILYLLILSIALSSCVSKKLYTEKLSKMNQYAENLDECEIQNQALLNENGDMSNRLILLQNQLEDQKSKSNMLEQQMSYYQSTNTNLLERLTDLSVVNKSGAESIRRSLEAINEQNNYIKDLNSAVRAKDSLNLALVMKLKRSLIDINDDDVNIQVIKGVVYISLSDKMLFKSGSYEINKQAETVLEKIARVLNDHNQFEFIVEGHTDDVPIYTDSMVDNWDLSVKRATSVVRLLQTKYGIDPARMTAGGRSEYVPKSSNLTAEGRAINRRTEIIILPKLDEFLELLDPTAEN